MTIGLFWFIFLVINIISMRKYISMMLNAYKY